MIKIIPCGSFNFGGEPIARLVETYQGRISVDWTKKASAVLDFADVPTKKGHSYIHLIALGDGERYGCNANGDWFGSGENKRKHDTFVKEGHVYREHRHHDPSLAIGKILKSAHNDPMWRVELIIEAPNNSTWEPGLSKLASGKQIGFSMACHVSHDVCSICGNRARTRNEYCDDLKNHLTKVARDGRLICAENPDPSFFDVSWVDKPADKTAQSLRYMKAASEGRIVCGAELAEQILAPFDTYRVDPLAKLAAKMAEMEKRFPAFPDKILRVLPGVAGQADQKVLTDLSEDFADHGPAILDKMAAAKISLNLPDFMTLLLGKRAGEFTGEVKEACRCLPHLYTDAIAEGESFQIPAGDGRNLPSNIWYKAACLLESNSLDNEAMARRISRTPAVKAASLGTAQHAGDVSPAARTLARLYGGYQLGLASRYADDSEFLGRLVMQNISANSAN